MVSGNLLAEGAAGIGVGGTEGAAVAARVGDFVGEGVSSTIGSSRVGEPVGIVVLGAIVGEGVSGRRVTILLSTERQKV